MWGTTNNLSTRIMERDCDSALFTVVPRSRFKLLQSSGRYERRNRGILVGIEKLLDGREDFIVLDSEWALWERIEREVLAEASRVADIGTPIIVKEPPKAQPTDSGIPAGDKAAAFKVGLGEGQALPEHPESSRRPSWFRSGFDPFVGR
jgi:hypothetical protein